MTYLARLVVMFSKDQNHILWDCTFSKRIWKWVFEWWGVGSKFSQLVNFNLWSWMGWFHDNSIKVDWGVTLAATMWSLWLNRNRVVFENKFYADKDVLELIKITSFYLC